MDKELFEVTKEDYMAFIRQIKHGCFYIEREENNQKVFSKNTGKLLAEWIDDNYYIYELPENNERAPAKPVARITLESPEEVQAFINAINKFYKAGQNNG